MRTASTYNSFNQLIRRDFDSPLDPVYETFTYDAARNNGLSDGILTGMQMVNGDTISYTYDELQRMTYRELNSSKAIGGMWEQWVYEGTRVIRRLAWSDDNTKIWDHHYTYDNLGNITKASNIQNGAYVTYSYDRLGQLTGSYHSTGKAEQYTYDNGGNLLTFNNGHGISHTYTYGDSQWKDLLTQVDGVALTYDAIGNPLTYYNGTGYTMTWTEGRRLAQVTRGTQTSTYEYDADGLRTRKNNPDGSYILYQIADGRYFGETYYHNYGWADLYIRYNHDESGNVVGISLWDAGISHDWTEYYFLKNLQGDVVAIYQDNAGTPTLAASYEYDAWGRLLSVTGPMADSLGSLNPLRYRGYVYDTETGFYYVSSRYYDPEIGRFINADTTDVLTATPMGLTDKNLFAYCDNNPVMRADYGGDFWHIVVGAAAGALIGGVVKAVSNAIEGKSLTDGLATAMLAGAASGALASTGVGIVGMVAGNAAISMAENAANQVIENKGFNNFDVGDMLIDGAIGGVSGALGGAGKGTKHLTNLGKQTVKRTFNATTNKGLKAGLKEAGKAFAYYGKNSAKYYKTFVKGLPSDFISTVGTTIASSNYMKYQYRRIFGR